MTIELILEICTQALLTVIYVIGPPLGAAMTVGLTLAIFQAATQIQETSLTFVPKMLAIGLTLLVTGRWGINHLLAFMREIMTHFEGVVK